ncbi:MerR family transcriptional regulator [Streptomyces goshikiensis]|uniref:MerR family transcriptional regulator n=1 Tax=Streptomyces goshikiensis TaxID=1942 RepID=UPI0033713140
MRDEDRGPAVRAIPARVVELSRERERERIDRMIGDLLCWREVLDEVIATGGGQPSTQPAA